MRRYGECCTSHVTVQHYSQIDVLSGVYKPCLADTTVSQSDEDARCVETLLLIDL